MLTFITVVYITAFVGQPSKACWPYELFSPDYAESSLPLLWVMFLSQIIWKILCASLSALPSGSRDPGSITQIQNPRL